MEFSANEQKPAVQNHGRTDHVVVVVFCGVLFYLVVICSIY